MLSAPIRKVMDKGRMPLATSAASVNTAAKRMARAGVGALLVMQGKRLVGIFTERDAVFRVIARDLDPARTRLGDVMTPDPVAVSPDESFGYALILMQERGFRHLPVVEHGVPIGLVSARDALDPDLEEFEAEARRRENIRRRA
jgi:CBS domain-containing protein